MSISIRQEGFEDNKLTEQVVKSAFANMELSDQKEHALVSRIRKNDVIMALELKENTLAHVTGVVEYLSVFSE